MPLEIKHKIANGQARPTESIALGRAMKKKDRKSQLPVESLPAVDFSEKKFIAKNEIPFLVEQLQNQLKFDQTNRAVINVSDTLTKKEKRWVQESFANFKVTVTFITIENNTQIKIER